MLGRLAQGGEVARSVVRELFPGGIWLYPDPDGGRHLWAYAQTAMLHPAGLVDSEGRSMAEGFPRVYSGVATEPRNDQGVDGSGSGGVLWNCSIFPLFTPKRVRGTVLPPSRCGNGHELTPDSLLPAERGTRWRCRQCGADRAGAWRRRAEGRDLSAQVASDCLPPPAEGWRNGEGHSVSTGGNFPEAASCAAR
jgi:hypothetical protein